jgi:GNAT superfamily N-acetyltransferase
MEKEIWNTCIWGGIFVAFLYHKAGREDIETLIITRLEMLRSINKLPETANLTDVVENCRAYYLKSFEKDIHVAYLVFDGETPIGCGGISYYQVMPSIKNPSGMKAYIMNIYTVPEYRGKGIATRVVDLLVTEAHKRNIHKIALDATDMGRPLYERYGFVPDDTAMKLAEKENP